MLSFITDIQHDGFGRPDRSQRAVRCYDRICNLADVPTTIALSPRRLR